jgi:polysaccharide biosynthesis/export protein
MWSKRLSLLCCVCVVSWLSPKNAGAEAYLLQPGDSLSLMIVGAPEMSRTIAIEMDGTASFPAIGEIPVGGTSLGEVRERVAQAYSVTSLAGPSEAGFVPRFVLPSQVNVSVQEYRPIYVTGDVLSPREIEFRPGLTLQQIVALANVGEPGQGNQYAVRESVEAAQLELSRAYARIWGLKRQLRTDTPQDYDNIFVAETEAIREIANLEVSMVEARKAERERQERALEESIRRAESRLAALLQQKSSEEEGLQLDEQIAAEVRKLFERNSPLAPASRLAEARRSALVGASRVLQLQVTAENVRTELAELKAQAAMLETGTQSSTWSELSDALTLAQRKRADLTALQTAASAGVLDQPAVAVITRGGQMLPAVTVSESDRTLQPGDVVEIVRGGRDGGRG